MQQVAGDDRGYWDEEFPPRNNKSETVMSWGNITCMGRIAALVLLKLFINEIDLPHFL